MEEHVQIDAYVLDTLMRDLIGHDRRPSAYLVYLAILSRGGGRPLTVSHQQLAERVGLSKRAVQDAVAHLHRRGLLRIGRRGGTEPALLEPLTPWRQEATPLR